VVRSSVRVGKFAANFRPGVREALRWERDLASAAAERNLVQIATPEDANPEHAATAD
jgi:hypothetical protein